MQPLRPLATSWPKWPPLQHKSLNGTGMTSTEWPASISSINTFLNVADHFGRTPHYTPLPVVLRLLAIAQGTISIWAFSIFWIVQERWGDLPWEISYGRVSFCDGEWHKQPLVKRSPSYPDTWACYHLARSPNCDVVITPHHWWLTPFDLAIGSIPKSQWSHLELFTSFHLVYYDPYQFLHINTICRMSCMIIDSLKIKLNYHSPIAIVPSTSMLCT